MFHGDRRKLIPLTYINNGYIRRKRHTDEFKSKNMKGIDVKKKKTKQQPAARVRIVGNVQIVSLWMAGEQVVIPYIKQGKL